MKRLCSSRTQLLDYSIRPKHSSLKRCTPLKRQGQRGKKNKLPYNQLFSQEETYIHTYSTGATNWYSASRHRFLSKFAIALKNSLCWLSDVFHCAFFFWLAGASIISKVPFSLNLRLTPNLRPRFFNAFSDIHQEPAFCFDATHSCCAA